MVVQLQKEYCIDFMAQSRHAETMRKNAHTERGSVLWFILVGIVLLGALTIILSRSGSSVDQSGDIEKLNVQASQIMRYARSLETAAQQMTLQGISENEISFQNADSTTDYTNSNCDDSGDRNYPYCQVFNSQGAGLNYMTPSASWLNNTHSGETYYGDWLITGEACIPDVGTGDSSTCDSARSEKELLVILPYIKSKLCQRLNKQASAPITSANPPADDGTAWSESDEFTGSFIASGTLIADSPVADLSDNTTGCFEGGGTPASGTYHFYHVILAR